MIDLVAHAQSFVCDSYRLSQLLNIRHRDVVTKVNIAERRYGIALYSCEKSPRGQRVVAYNLSLQSLILVLGVCSGPAACELLTAVLVCVSHDKPRLSDVLADAD